MPGRNRIITASALLAASALAGCSGHPGSFDVEDNASTKWDNLTALVTFKTPPKAPRPSDPIKCPEITVLEGTSADRVYTTKDVQSNDALRYQFSVIDVARDCRIDGNQISMKVGVDGKI